MGHSSQHSIVQTQFQDIRIFSPPFKSQHSLRKHHNPNRCTSFSITSSKSLVWLLIATLRQKVVRAKAFPSRNRANATSEVHLPANHAIPQSPQRLCILDTRALL